MDREARLIFYGRVFVPFNKFSTATFLCLVPSQYLDCHRIISIAFLSCLPLKKRPNAIAKMNYKLNIESTMVGSVNTRSYLTNI